MQSKQRDGFGGLDWQGGRKMQAERQKAGRAPKSNNRRVDDLFKDDVGSKLLGHLGSI